MQMFASQGCGRKCSQRIVTTRAAFDDKAAAQKSDYSNIDDRINSGEFTEGSTREQVTRPIRKVLRQIDVPPARFMAYQLAVQGRQWRKEAKQRMPEARGDIREIVGDPVFIPLYKLFMAYGDIFKLSFGPQSFVVVSNPDMARQVLFTNAEKYSKGILSEILDFIMGQGLIPANGEVWKTRRRAVVPSLHKRYVAKMVDLFGACVQYGTQVLDKSAKEGKSVEMENFFSRYALDVIGKAVFNYNFDSLTKDDPVIEAVYTALREAEYRSTYPLPYWNLPLIEYIVPRQKRCKEAIVVINKTLDELIAKSQKVMIEEDAEFEEEFLSDRDPSILHFLLAAGDDLNSKQLRDDLMTMLIAGHETTAAVLTWTFHLLSQHPKIAKEVQNEVDTVLGDRLPTMEDFRNLAFTTRVINESMRLYPQPPVLIRRALEDDNIGGYPINKGDDMFISVWNLHRSPKLWEEPDRFNPYRFPLDQPIPNEQNQGFAFLPFGGGRRKCVGDQFAMFEAIVALSVLMRRYDFKMAPDAPAVGMTTGATIHTTNGLHMVMQRRQLADGSLTGDTSTGESIMGSGVTAGDLHLLGDKMGLNGAEVAKEKVEV